MHLSQIQIISILVLVVAAVGISSYFALQPAGEFIKPVKPAPEPEPDTPLLSQTTKQADKTAYFYANGQKIVSMDAGGILYYITDHLGGTNKVYDADGNLVSEVEYYAYGQDKLETGEEQDYKYTGKEKDDSTGLYYYGARYYEPFAGRFTAIDKVKGNIQDPQNLNRYTYTRNNPLKYADPSGNSMIMKSGGHSGGYYINQKLDQWSGELYDKYKEQTKKSDAELGIGGILSLIGYAAGAAALKTVSAFVPGDEDILPTPSIAIGSGASESFFQGGFKTIRNQLKKVLYRGDSREPYEIFKIGFKPQGDVDWFGSEAHLHGIGSSKYISTSTKKSVATRYAVDNSESSSEGYLYYIQRPKNAINSADLVDNPYSYEAEVLIHGEIPSSSIIGARPIRVGTREVQYPSSDPFTPFEYETEEFLMGYGKFEPNPNFVPGE